MIPMWWVENIDSSAKKYPNVIEINVDIEKKKCNLFLNLFLNFNRKNIKIQIEINQINGAKSTACFVFFAIKS